MAAERTSEQKGRRQQPAAAAPAGQLLLLLSTQYLMAPRWAAPPCWHSEVSAPVQGRRWPLRRPPAAAVRLLLLLAPLLPGRHLLRRSAAGPSWPALHPWQNLPLQAAPAYLLGKNKTAPRSQRNAFFHRRLLRSAERNFRSSKAIAPRSCLGGPTLSLSSRDAAPSPAEPAAATLAATRRSRSSYLDVIHIAIV